MTGSRQNSENIRDPMLPEYLGKVLLVFSLVIPPSLFGLQNQGHRLTAPRAQFDARLARVPITYDDNPDMSSNRQLGKKVLRCSRCRGQSGVFLPMVVDLSRGSIHPLWCLVITPKPNPVCRLGPGTPRSSCNVLFGTSLMV
jgi:hypothetical protein